MGLVGVDNRDVIEVRHRLHCFHPHPQLATGRQHDLHVDGNGGSGNGNTWGENDKGEQEIRGGQIWGGGKKGVGEREGEWVGVSGCKRRCKIV